MVAEQVKSVDEVVNLTEEPKLAKLQKVDATLTYKSIGRLLARMAVHMHIPNGLSVENIKSIAQRITTDREVLWWLTLADIDLLCRRIVAGDYGHFYGHFAEAEFNDCFKKYCAERTEVHRQQNDKTVSKADSEVLAEVGYKVGKDGRLIVPAERQGVTSKPSRYLYNGSGKIAGENPAFWAGVRREAEKTPEEVRHINRHNSIMERTMQIMDERKVPYYDAYKLAIEEKEQSKITTQ